MTDSPGITSGPCGSSDIWISCAMRSSSSSRFFSSFCAQQILDARGHLVERSGQLAELIVRRDGDLVREVALPDALGAGEQLVDRSGDRSRQRGADDERDDLDDEEQTADDDQQDEQERLAERAIADHALRGGDAPVDVLNIQLRGDEQRARLAAVPVAVVEERHPAERPCEVAVGVAPRDRCALHR